VWLVELAPVTDPAEVPSAVLAALGLREQALMYARGTIGTVIDDTDALSRLLAALAGRRALLVLDNCEHLVAAAARLAGQVLSACPHVRILATSREPLAITGEALWTVGPLTLPPDPAVPYQADQTHSAERAGVPAPAIDDYAAVRLLGLVASPYHFTGEKEPGPDSLAPNMLQPAMVGTPSPARLPALA
jgi:predicted ATPase